VSSSIFESAVHRAADRLLTPQKAAKLKRDPAQFLRDSRFAPLRAVGSLYGAGQPSQSSNGAAEAPSLDPIAELDSLAMQFGTDKSSYHHNYVRYYGPYFARFKHQDINFLELGIKDGASLRMWKAFLPRAHIVGLDNREVSKGYAEPGIDVHVGLQQDHDFLDRVAQATGGPFHIILDDASHHNPFTIESFRGLFKHLAPGGIYAIEDLHCSYEEHKLFNNERQQMTDFFIELINAVDLNGRREIYKPIRSAQDFAKVSTEQRTKLSELERWVESVHFYQGLVFIIKREADV